jgi:hypothetical protein
MRVAVTEGNRAEVAHIQDDGRYECWVERKCQTYLHYSLAAPPKPSGAKGLAGLGIEAIA